MIGHWCETCGTEWDDNGPAYVREITRLTAERDERITEVDALRIEVERLMLAEESALNERDALLAACEDISAGGCVNRLRHEPCGDCDPCIARAAINNSRATPQMGAAK